MQDRRERTYSWQDPQRGAAAARDMSGLEYLAAIRDGALPAAPIADSLDFTLATVDEGRVVFEVTPAEFHYNPIGMVHGGLAATLLDSAASCAVHSTLPVAARYATLEMKINYVRPVGVETGRLRAIGTVLHRGRRTATAEARLVDDQDRLYAHATVTCLLFEVRNGK